MTICSRCQGHGIDLVLDGDRIVDGRSLDFDPCPDCNGAGAFVTNEERSEQMPEWQSW